MSERRPQRPIRAHCIAFLAVALILVLLPARFTSSIQTTFLSLVWPAQAVTTKAARGASLLLSGFFGSFRAARQLDALRRQVQQQQAIIAKQENDIRRLTDQLEQIRSVSPFVAEREIESIIPAQIVSFEISAGTAAVIINAGSRAGVRPDSALLCGKIAIGRITHVGPWASRAKLLTEIGHSSQVKIARTGNEGMLEGAGAGRFVLRFVSREADVQEGDMLVAPASSKYFPPGIALATITQVRLDPSDPAYRIAAAPLLDYSSLEDVIVVRRRIGPVSPTGTSEPADEL